MIAAHLIGRSAPQATGGPLLTLLLGAWPLICPAGAQADAAPAPPASSQTGASSAAQHLAAPHVVSRSEFADRYYSLRYGVDQLRVRYTASGASVEFRYRVVDPDKATMLSDKHVTPYMLDEKTGIKLLVPVMEQIGALRQTVPPQHGREYWLLFANAGKVVKPGQRVDVSIGSFHARGLTVE
jgi:hypothetical protein